MQTENPILHRTGDNKTEDTTEGPGIGNCYMN